MTKKKGQGGTQGMNLEDRRFMAFEGVHIWARAVIETAAKLNERRYPFPSSEFASPEALAAIRAEFGSIRRTFTYQRHFFLIAAHQLLNYGEWAVRLGVVSQDVFREYEAYKKEISVLRDSNEHVIQYFRGKGDNPEGWVWTGAEGTGDASSTSGTKIGGRLCWNDLATVTQRLIGQLPSYLDDSVSDPEP
jgi:hypothetical protein